ncbi:MAG: efflux RND transporter periplasmic adaptor subunit [Gammaproteobacteria bacterium]|nr:efflux RND transporter periplasmic adaptor subunit [Gammaproteobacteria bacterium]
MRHLFLSFLPLFISLASCNKLGQSEKAPVVSVIPPQQLISPLKKEYIGVIKSLQDVTLRARVEGFLNERLFKEGDIVHRGEVLYVIDKAPFQAQLLSADGNLKKAQADLAFQAVQLKRYEQLVKHQNVSKSNYDQQLAAYQAALGNLETAQGSYDQAKLNLSYCDVTSPLNGLAGKSYVDLGNLVSGVNKTELVKVVQLDPIRIEFNPSISDMNLFLKYKQYKPFHTVVKLPEAQDKKWQGIVDFYDNIASLNTSTMLLRTTIRNSDFLLRPDIYVNVSVTLDPKHNFKLIPIERMLEVQGVRQVQVVNKDKKLTWRAITIGDVHDKWVEVLDGLETDDLIVDDNTVKLQEGVIVNPIIKHINTKQA